MKRWLLVIASVCVLASVGCGGDDDASDKTAECAALMDCCDSLQQGQIGACYQVVEADQPNGCTDTQASYAMAGLCPAP